MITIFKKAQVGLFTVFHILQNETLLIIWERWQHNAVATGVWTKYISSGNCLVRLQSLVRCLVGVPVLMCLKFPNDEISQIFFLYSRGEWLNLVHMC